MIEIKKNFEGSGCVSGVVSEMNDLSSAVSNRKIEYNGETVGETRIFQDNDRITIQFQGKTS